MNKAVPKPPEKYPQWCWIDLPVGPQPLPDWFKGLHIDWMEQWSNRPNYRIKTDREIGKWEGETWVKEGGFYRAYHEDGRMEQYHHNSLLTFSAQARAWVTVKQEGFGGAESRLKMHSDVRQSFLGGAVRLAGDEWVFEEPVDGQRFAGNFHGYDVLLRGPWATGGPDGYVYGMSYFNVNVEWRIRKKQPWWQETACGGLFITEKLLVLALARFYPHLRAARIEDKRGTRVEPVREDWHAPKAMTAEQQVFSPIIPIP